MPKVKGETAHRQRSEFYREGAALPSVKAARHPIRFNSGPTPRHAVLDFMALCAEFPEAWDRTSPT